MTTQVKIDVWCVLRNDECDWANKMYGSRDTSTTREKEFNLD